MGSGWYFSFLSAALPDGCHSEQSFDRAADAQVLRRKVVAMSGSASWRSILDLTSLIVARLIAVAALATALPVVADPPGGTTTQPPAIPPFISPPVFCFRITDIRDVAGDLEGNAFDFEVEVLNWSNAAAFQLDLSLSSSLKPATLGGTPLFLPGGSSIDPNGRPGTPADDEGTYSPADATVMPPKFGALNGWGVGISTPTNLIFATPGPGLPPRDLLGVLPGGAGPARTAAALALVPSESGPGSTPNFVDFTGRPNVPVFETIDNGGFAGDPLPDNALDGFVVRVDDFDPGEAVSVNWFLRDSMGASIGSSGGGNSYGFGNFNIARGASLDAYWRRQPGSPFGPGQNRGAALTLAPTAAMFTSVSDGGSVFATELGAGLTAPFANPADACPGCGVNAEPIPDPQFVDFGFDVLQTVSGQSYLKSPFTTNAGRLKGVPLSDAQFQAVTGASVPGIGADTIIRRNGVLDPLGPPQQQIPIEIVALSLQSVAPIDLGQGRGPETLNITLAGPQVQGILAVNFDRMTFSSLLPITFQVQGSNGTLFIDQIQLQVANAQFNSVDLSKVTIPGLNQGFLPLMFGGQGESNNGLQLLQTVMAPSTGLSGDFDLNGRIDGNDLLVWQRGGSPNPNSPGDLSLWKASFGANYATAASAAVPEPATSAALASLACLRAAAGRTRRTRRL
jgi:hypothetical protein